MILFLFYFQFKLIEWHDIRVDGFCFHFIILFAWRENRFLFYASSVTSHEPKREWLIGNFSSDCADLTFNFLFFFFLCFVGHLSLPSYFRKPVDVSLLSRLCRFSIRIACIIKKIASSEIGFWSQIFVGQAAGESQDLSSREA